MKSDADWAAVSLEMALCSYQQPKFAIEWLGSFGGLA